MAVHYKNAFQGIQLTLSLSLGYLHFVLLLIDCFLPLLIN